MVSLDYAVLAWPEIPTVQAYESLLRSFVRLPTPCTRIGYIGMAGTQAFFGYSPYAKRFLLALTGEYADECAPKIPHALDAYASVARVDVQATFKVRNADECIGDLRHSRRCKATRMIAEDEPGAALYIGSMESDLFCRIYNKSAEASIPPDENGEFVRIEFCLRDDCADKIWKTFREGTLDEAFCALTSRMLAEESAARVLELARIGLSEQDREALRTDVYDERERRLKQVENIVVPELNKIVTEAPWLLEEVWNALNNLPRVAGSH